MSVIFVAILLLLGASLRARIAWLERVRIPASVVAGVLGCLVAQTLIVALSSAGDAQVQAVLSTFRGWAGLLISIVFAGLLLAPSGQSVGRSREVWQQGVVAWIIILGQLALGLLATALLIRPFYDVPGPFGQFIEVTMAGGFGSSNSMATILEAEPYRFAPARDLLVFGATAGLVWGVVSGLFLAHWGAKRGWTTRAARVEAGASSSGTRAVGTEASRLVLEPILLQFCFLMVALGLGMLMQWGVAWLGLRLDVWLDPEGRRISQNLGNLPLFFFALLGGWLTRAALTRLRLERVLDRDLLHRLSGIAMDVLIVTSLTAIAFNELRAYLWPVLLLLAIGSAWSIFCLVWVSPRLLPRCYWFELGLINYGFSTAATAQGMMLLKIVDPNLKSGAAETYALGAPLTAPFIGGGVITFAVLPVLIGGIGLFPVALITLAAVGVFAAVGKMLVRREVL